MVTAALELRPELTLQMASGKRYEGGNMQSIGDIAKQYLADKHHPVSDSMTISEALTQLQTVDHEAFLGLLNTIFNGNNDADKHNRARIKAEADERDHIHWGTSVSTSIPDDQSDFENFEARTQYPTVQAAQLAVQKWINMEGPGLLVLAGPPGVGKSHLLKAAAKRLHTNHPEANIIYIKTENVLQSMLTGSVKTGQLSEVMQDLCGSPILILDDFGASAGTDWYRSQLDQIIDMRWDNSEVVRTLLSTNLLSQDLPPRMASRLSDKRLAVNVVINAEDYRKGGR
jgi:DNA replication protein DnaC